MTPVAVARPSARGRLAALAALAVLWLGPAAGLPSAHAEPESFRVGVVVITAIGMDLDDAETVGARMARALGEQLYVDVEIGTRERLGKRPPETCEADIQCIHALGARLGARELLFLAIVRIGNRLQINVTWAHAATGASETRDPIRLESADEAGKVFAEAAARLLPGARVRPRDPGPSDSGTRAPMPGTDVLSGAPTPIEGPATRRLTSGVWIAGGISVLALAGGTTFGIMALRTQGRLEDAGCDPGPCQEPAPEIATLERQALISDALFATAVVSGVVAGVLYWRSDRADSPRVTVGATPGSIQLSYTGSF